MGIMEKKMENIMIGYIGFRVEDLGFKIRSQFGVQVLYWEFGVFGHTWGLGRLC